ncbi:hypothetical protein T484DRAFT_1756632, partial [Baffinella frigidus]
MAVSERFLAGMVMTTTCGLQLTDREDLCWGVLSGAEGRTELRRKRDEILDTVLVVLVLVVLVLLVALIGLRGFGGVRRNHATESMLWALWGKCNTKRERRLSEVPLHAPILFRNRKTGDLVTSRSSFYVWFCDHV